MSKPPPTGYPLRFVGWQHPHGRHRERCRRLGRPRGGNVLVKWQQDGKVDRVAADLLEVVDE